MIDLPFAAVALGDEIQRFGSYFGYAAIVGLGVLSLLYFAQAREVKRLREWAGRAPERDAELAQRVQSDAQRRVVAQPIATPAAAAPPASPQTAAAQSADAARKAAAAAVMEKFQSAGTAPAPTIGPPGSLARTSPAAGAAGAAAPAGSASAAPGAPAPGSVAAANAAAAAATPGAPAPAPGSVAAANAAAAAATPGAPAPAPGSVAAANAAAAAATAPGAPAPGSVANAAAPAAPAPGSAPPPAAGGEGAAAPGASAAPALVPPVPPGMSAATAGAVAAARQAATPSRSASYANGAAGQDTHESDAARPEPLPDLPPRRPRASAATASAREPGMGRGRIGAIAAAGTVLVLGIVLVIVLTSGGTDAPPASNEIGDASPPPAAAPPPAASAGLTKAERAATRVTVLNGTTQTGLARAVAGTIEKKGFTILGTETNADQQIATTTVSYAPGSERAARAVAVVMKVPASAVQPIDANTSVAASPEAKIVVLVGSDKSGAG